MKTYIQSSDKKPSRHSIRSLQLKNLTLRLLIAGGFIDNRKYREATKIAKGLLAVLIACLALSFSGCSTLQKIQKAATFTVSEQTSDNLVDAAEKTTLGAKDTMDTFLSLEKKHRVAYAKISPKIREFADKLRRDDDGNGQPFGIDLLESCINATEAFRENRTPENETNLRSAWKALQDILADAKKYSALTLTTG